VRLPPPALAPDAAAELRGVLGADALRDDHRERVLHAAGKGYPDLVAIRAGHPQSAPDAVAYPEGAAQLRAVLEICSQRRVAVVPFGGGTSVVGGVAPLRGDQEAVITVDLRRLAEPLALDRESLTVTCGAGLRVAALEARLAAGGLTLGHFPQSFEYVSVGGCAATRSAGQASTGYGRFDERVLGVRCTAPAGELTLAPVPASAAGPDLRELLVGSEGALGVLTEVALRVSPAPRARIYEGVFFETFAGGIAALRALAQDDATPTVVRLSDEQETSMSLALAGAGGVKGAAGRVYLRARGYAEGCLLVLGFEGEPERIAARRRLALALVGRHGGLAVGRTPGRAWAAGRFAGPYLRDDLLTQGVMVETLETATQWSLLTSLYRAVGRAIAAALRERGTPGRVMCHVSHLYETGASLYFTFLAPQQEGREIEQWSAVKQAASAAIVANGGTITHHHAVGVDHRPWLADEIGAEGVELLRDLKQRLDPAGIMNPGKLLPDRDGA
jgi:alkyldihydroxyacetonephosphate synthase